LLVSTSKLYLLKKLLIIGGGLLIVMAVITTPRTFAEYNVQKHGQLVGVTLLKLPNCSFGYKNKFLTLDYEEHRYTLRTSCKYIKNFQEGQQIQMLHGFGSNIFLFQNEDLTIEILSTIGLARAGIVIIVIGFKKKY
jgi:hypothetical protein